MTTNQPLLPNNTTIPTRLTLTECPRDAMQGWPNIITTANKVAYLNALIKSEIDIIDCGSFVSAKAIPQMADTAEVLNRIDTSYLKSGLLVIVANERGALQATQFKAITHIGFPFSISETFQLKNTNKTLAQSMELIIAIQKICIAANKKLVIYISMAFGNPYGNVYNHNILLYWLKKMEDEQVLDIRLSDTVGLATAQNVKNTTQQVINNYSNKTAIGLHLHGTKVNTVSKIMAGLQAGCLRFDAAIGGIGGCPLAGTSLVGNIDTQLFLNTITMQGYYCNYNKTNFNTALNMAKNIFI